MFVDLMATAPICIEVWKGQHKCWGYMIPETNGRCTVYFDFPDTMMADRMTLTSAQPFVCYGIGPDRGDPTQPRAEAYRVEGQEQTGFWLEEEVRGRPEDIERMRIWRQMVSWTQFPVPRRYPASAGESTPSQRGEHDLDGMSVEQIGALLDQVLEPGDEP